MQILNIVMQQVAAELSSKWSNRHNEDFYCIMTNDLQSLVENAYSLETVMTNENKHRIRTQYNTLIELSDLWNRLIRVTQNESNEQDTRTFIKETMLYQLEKKIEFNIDQLQMTVSKLEE